MNTCNKKRLLLFAITLISCQNNATCTNLFSKPEYIPIASSNYTKSSWKDSANYYTEISSTDLHRGDYKIFERENSNEFKISITNPSAAFSIPREQAQDTIHFKIDESGMKVSVLYGNNQESTNGFNLPYPAAIALRSKVIQPVKISADTIELIIPKAKNVFTIIYYWLHRESFKEWRKQ